MAKTKKCDVFPSIIINKMEDIKIPNLSTVDSEKVYTFIIYMEDETDKIYYYPIKAISTHFANTRRQLQSNNIKDIKPLTWKKTMTRLKKNIINQNNTDIRTCFKWDNHCFLTKKHFTFGLRHVQPGTYHLLNVLSVPINFYYLDEKKKKILETNLKK